MLCKHKVVGSSPTSSTWVWLVNIPAGPVVGRYRKIETGSTPSGEKANLNPYTDITGRVECYPYKIEVESSSLSVGTNLRKDRLGV